MRARDFLIEKIIKPATAVDQTAMPPSGEPGSDPLYDLKLAIANKIKVLPPDEKTQKALQEIEDLLAHVGAGGRKGHIGSELESINDKDVHRARSLLAKYVLSLDMTAQQRSDLFSRWKNDKLVDISALLSVGKHTIPEIIIGYDDPKNPAIKELVDDLSQVAALGQGKGEFLLSVLSKRITKLHKGDLDVAGRQIEVKTQDVGGGRFYDQEVRPDSSYSANVSNILKTWPPKAGLKVKATSGLKLIDLISLGEALPPAEKEQYFGDVTKLLQSIFPGMDVSGILRGMQVGNIGAAKQAYAVTNLDYYRNIKTEDEGILFIDLSKSVAEFVFFRNAAELAVGGLRLHANTVYPVSSDPRNAYPQMRIIATKAGSVPTETPSIAPVPAKPKAKPKLTKPAVTPPSPTTPPPGIANQNTTLATSKIPMGQQPR